MKTTPITISREHLVVLLDMLATQGIRLEALSLSLSAKDVHASLKVVSAINTIEQMTQQLDTALDVARVAFDDSNFWSSDESTATIDHR